MKWEIGLSTGIAYRAPIGDVLPYISDWRNTPSASTRCTRPSATT